MDKALTNFSKTNYFNDTEIHRKIKVKKYTDRLDMMKLDGILLEGAQGDFRRLLWESERQYLEGSMSRGEWEKHEVMMLESVRGVADQIGLLGKKRRKAVEKLEWYCGEVGREGRLAI